MKCKPLALIYFILFILSSKSSFTSSTMQLRPTPCNVPILLIIYITDKTPERFKQILLLLLTTTKVNQMGRDYCLHKLKKVRMSLLGLNFPTSKWRKKRLNMRKKILPQTSMLQVTLSGTLIACIDTSLTILATVFPFSHAISSLGLMPTSTLASIQCGLLIPISSQQKNDCQQKNTIQG